jgi:hypothetical protein
MSSDITKYVYKENENNSIFFVDTEDYTENGQHLQGYEDGDVVKWTWESNRYYGTLRNYGNSNNGIFIISDAKKI